MRRLDTTWCADAREQYNEMHAERGRDEANARNSVVPDATFKVRGVISMPTPAGVAEIEYFKEAEAGFDSFDVDDDESDRSAPVASGSRNGVHVASAQESERVLNQSSRLFQVMESMEA